MTHLPDDGDVPAPPPPPPGYEPPLYGNAPGGYGQLPPPAYGQPGPPGYGSTPPGYGSTPPGYGSTPPGYRASGPGAPPHGPWASAQPGPPPDPAAGWRANPVTPTSPHGPDGPPLDTSEERLWATLGHVGGVLAVYPPIGVLPSLIIFLVYRKRSGFVRDQSLEALNFQIAVLIVQVVLRILVAIALPGLLFWVIWAVSVVFSIMGAIAANQGERYRYPLTFRFIT